MLVAASAVIPIFGFHDWTYHRLHEVLIYPDAFDDAYRTRGGSNEAMLGMVGLHNLSGVMILSKPALLTGFDRRSGKQNVGIHEFAHMVEQEERAYGLPPEVPWMAIRQWMRYVDRELGRPSKRGARFIDYAYTNEHEFFAMLTEYFFTSPGSLKRRDPALYGLLRELFDQDTGRCSRLCRDGAAGSAGTIPAPAAAARNTSTVA